MANINMRIDDNLKRDAEALFDELGLSMTAATTLFLKQCIRYQGLPFDGRLDPFYSADNQNHLRKAISDLDAGHGTVHDLIEVADE